MEFWGLCRFTEVEEVLGCVASWIRDVLDCHDFLKSPAVEVPRGCGASRGLIEVFGCGDFKELEVLGCGGRPKPWWFLESMKING